MDLHTKFMDFAGVNWQSFEIYKSCSIMELEMYSNKLYGINKGEQTFSNFLDLTGARNYQALWNSGTGVS